MDPTDPITALHTSLKEDSAAVTILLTDNTCVKGKLLASDEHANVVIRLFSDDGNNNSNANTCRFIRGALIRVIHSA